MEIIECDAAFNPSVNGICFIDRKINIRILADSIENAGIILCQLHVIRFFLVHGLYMRIFQVFSQG